MSKQSEYKIDRAGWPPGPWDGEPDRVDFEHAGFPCLILRHESGHLCGYAGVPLGHPMYEASLADIEVLSVHGGVTYAGKCRGPICHVPREGQPDDVFWLGFDCAHRGAGDYEPTDDIFWRQCGEYRTIEYVRLECEQLAEQFGEAAR